MAKKFVGPPCVQIVSKAIEIGVYIMYYLQGSL